MSINRNAVKVWSVFSLTVLCVLLMSSKTFAFQLMPTVSVINFPRDAGGVTVSLQNPRNVALPVEFEIVERFVNEDGSEDYTSADDLFLIFPPQAVINPGETQSVRIQWLDQAPETSRSFTLFAREIAVDLTQQNEPMVQTIMRIGASIHVASSLSKPQVAISDFSESPEGVQVTLENSGNRFIYLNDVELKFGSRIYSGHELANIAGRTLLPPSGKRTFVVPDEKGRPDVSIAR